MFGLQRGQVGRGVACEGGSVRAYLLQSAGQNLAIHPERLAQCGFRLCKRAAQVFPRRLGGRAGVLCLDLAVGCRCRLGQRLRQRALQRLQIRVRRGGKCGKVRPGARDIPGQRRQPLFSACLALLGRALARLGVGIASGKGIEALLGRTHGRFRSGDGSNRRIVLTLGLLQAGLKGRCFLGQPRLRCRAVGTQRVLALAVAGKVGALALEVGQASGQSLSFVIQRIGRAQQALKLGGGLRFALAQCGQRGGHLRLAGARAGGGARGFLHFCLRDLKGSPGARQLVGGVAPAPERQHRLARADLPRQRTVTLGMARLPTERRDLLLHLPGHVGQAGEVGVCSLEALFRFLAPAVQPGDAGGFLENRPAVGGLCGDDASNPPLTDQRSRLRAGGGVREQQLHILLADFLAIDAVAGAEVALDPAAHLQFVAAIEGGRGLAAAIVDQQGDIGEGARWPNRSAGEDHIFHSGAAQRPGAGLPHHPAQRLQQVGFAAAVGADDASQPGLDQQLGRIDKGFEARQPQSREAHAHPFRGKTGARITSSGQAASPSGPARSVDRRRTRR